MDFASPGNCSHCRYEKGETKSKYQSALGIDGQSRNDFVPAFRPPPLEHRYDRTLLLRRQVRPRRDVGEGPKTARAEARHAIDAAHAVAWRRDGSVFRREHHAALVVDSGSLASSARATRDTGSRPRCSEMNLPARRSLVKSTP